MYLPCDRKSPDSLRFICDPVGQTGDVRGNPPEHNKPHDETALTSGYYTVELSKHQQQQACDVAKQLVLTKARLLKHADINGFLQLLCYNVFILLTFIYSTSHGENIN